MALILLSDSPRGSATAPPEPEALPHARTSADELAAANVRANVFALSLTQPNVVDAALHDEPDEFTWTFARDGSLTALDQAGWWDGCSVPLLAARAMLKTLDPQGRVACFLRPTQAAHVRVALEMLRADQAVVAVVPDVAILRIILRCADFSEPIGRGRLWFAGGEDWPRELGRVFQDNPGLATPSQFVRLPVTPAEEVERMVTAAQVVFAEHNAARAAAITSLRVGWNGQTRTRRLCVLAPSTFRLWNDPGRVLGEVSARESCQAELTSVQVDPDCPRRASLLALASTAASCDALLTANVGRSDLPDAAPVAMPWVTWVTTPRVPSVRGAGPNDALLLADPAWAPDAKAAGWPCDRIHFASWPVPFEPLPPAPSGGCLVVVADTCAVHPPERLAEFSSHLLLWERLRSDISADPFRVGDDAERFLDRMLRQFNVSGEGIDRRLFIDRLIVPAYQQAIARVLMRERLPVRLHGAGWDRIEEFRPRAGGPVNSCRLLRRIARDAAALVHVWPSTCAHPIDAIGRPVIRRRDMARRSFLGDALRALAGRAEYRQPPGPYLSLSVVLRSLGWDEGSP